MKKAISYMACSMAAMLALSACGSAASSASTVASSSDAASTESTAASEASNEPVTITFAQYSGSGDNEQYLQQMVDNYMKENPNVTIDLQTYGYDDYFTQMTAKVSGGQAPDVFELDYQNFVSYAKKGALMPLDDILTKDGIDTSTMPRRHPRMKATSSSCGRGTMPLSPTWTIRLGVWFPHWWRNKLWTIRSSCLSPTTARCWATT